MFNHDEIVYTIQISEKDFENLVRSDVLFGVDYIINRVAPYRVSYEDNPKWKEARKKYLEAKKILRDIEYEERNK